MDILRRFGVDTESKEYKNKLDLCKIYAFLGIGGLLIFTENYRAQLETLAEDNLRKVESVLNGIDKCEKSESGDSYTWYDCPEGRLMLTEVTSETERGRGLMLRTDDGIRYIAVSYRDPKTDEYSSFVTTQSLESDNVNEIISRRTGISYLRFTTLPSELGRKTDSLYTKISLGLERE